MSWLSVLPSLFFAPLASALFVALAAPTSAVSATDGVFGRVFVPKVAMRRAPSWLRAALARVTSTVREFARFAGSRESVRGTNAPRVVARERMTVAAMRLAGVQRSWGIAAHRVLAWKDRLQMRGVHAAPIAAQVVELQRGIDGADQNRVCRAVCEPHAVAARVQFRADLSVSVITEAGPVPARVRAVGIRNDC